MENLITKRQSSYIVYLQPGYSIDPKTTIKEASAIIKNLLAEKKNGGKPIKKSNKTCIGGVKIGDVFSMSWGYDQTNNNSFEVVEIVSKTFVEVKEIAYETVSGICPCSWNEKPKKGEYLDRSFWDRENGGKSRNGSRHNLMRKKVQVATWYDGKPYICFEKGYYKAYLDEAPENARYASER